MTKWILTAFRPEFPANKRQQSSRLRLLLNYWLATLAPGRVKGDERLHSTIIRGNARDGCFFHLIIKASTERRDSRAKKGMKWLQVCWVIQHAFLRFETMAWERSRKTRISINWKGKQKQRFFSSLETLFPVLSRVNSFKFNSTAFVIAANGKNTCWEVVFKVEYQFTLHTKITNKSLCSSLLSQYASLLITIGIAFSVRMKIKVFQSKFKLEHFSFENKIRKHSNAHSNNSRNLNKRSWSVFVQNISKTFQIQLKLWS